MNSVLKRSDRNCSIRAVQITGAEMDSSRASLFWCINGLIKCEWRTWVSLNLERAFHLSSLIKNVLSVPAPSAQFLGKN